MASNINSGFNEEKVNAALRNLNSDYTNMMESLKSQVQKFVSQIGQEWASPNAVKFFKSEDGVETVLKKLSTDVTSTLNSVNLSVNSAADRKATDNGGTHNKVSFNEYTFVVNYSSIVDNINGNVGVDKNHAEITANDLKNVINDVDDYLRKIRISLEDSGILDSAAQNSLNESISQIRNNISKAIENIVDGAIEGIKLTVSQNGDSDGAIANAFRGQ